MVDPFRGVQPRRQDRRCLPVGRGVVMWDADSGKVIRTLEPGFAGMALSPDGKTVATATATAATRFPKGLGSGQVGHQTMGRCHRQEHDHVSRNRRLPGCSRVQPRRQRPGSRMPRER